MLLGYAKVNFIFSGPLTYTDKRGKTTVFGIVSGPGRIPAPDNLGLGPKAYVRVSNPEILNWIKEEIRSNNQD